MVLSQLSGGSAPSHRRTWLAPPRSPDGPLRAREGLFRGYIDRRAEGAAAARGSRGWICVSRLQYLFVVSQVLPVPHGCHAHRPLLRLHGRILPDARRPDHVRRVLFPPAPASQSACTLRPQRWRVWSTLLFHALP